MKTLKGFIGFLIIVLLSFIIIPLPVAAFDWHTANQGTVAWDAVTSTNNGDTIPEADTIEYSVYVSDSLLTQKDSSVVAWRGPETSTLLSFDAEGAYFIGVKAHRIRDGTQISSSIIVWSDDPQATNNSPFGFSYWLPPSIVQGLRPG